ncbi:hypothetical protein F4679DRAFT_437418 [Xylaria curta]|nr:hypothetical protein F4679DRAFT_437418 [Xylaria curta]
MAERKGKWSEDEKVHYLMLIIEQFMSNGSKITGLQTLSIPSRTPKACMNFWDKVRHHHGDYLNADATATAAASGSEQPSTPAPKLGAATPGSRKRTAKTALIGGDDADELTLTPTKRPRKAPAKSKAKAAAQVIQAADEDDSVLIKSDIKQQDDDFEEGVI